jgi:hypothetical protein
LGKKEVIGVVRLKSLGLVSCTKRKQVFPCKASEMYLPSNLFSKAYDYCKKNYNQVAILSAKYGLLSSDDPIKPYDLTLKNMRDVEVRAWSEKVFNQMQKRIDVEKISSVFFHAGDKYRKYLTPLLKDLGIKCETPLLALSIGKQLRWYNEHDCQRPCSFKVLIIAENLPFNFFLFSARSLGILIKTFSANTMG